MVGCDVDAPRFDRLDRSFSDLLSRRAALGAGLSGVLGGTLTGSATARRRRKKEVVQAWGVRRVPALQAG